MGWDDKREVNGKRVRVLRCLNVFQQTPYSNNNTGQAGTPNKLANSKKIFGAEQEVQVSAEPKKKRRGKVATEPDSDFSFFSTLGVTASIFVSRTLAILT